MLSVVAQIAISVADAAFVGLLGTEALAALALVFPAQMIMGMMSAGAMGGGISSAVARALGAGDRAKAQAAALHAIVIALVMACAFVIVFVGFGRPIFGAMDGSGAALDGAVANARVLFLGAAAPWLANSLASILRGSGDMRTPAVALVAGALIQIPLSGALTLGWGPFPPLGVVGPAAAAVVSFAGSAIWMAMPLLGAGAAVRLRSAPLRLAPFLDILKVGAVGCVSVVLINLTIMMVTGLIGRAGQAALAGYGIGSRLEYMMVPLSFGIGATLTAMVGTNFGARRYARAQSAAWTGAAMAAAMAGLVGLVVTIFPDLWLSLFTTEPAVLEQGRLYLRMVGPLYALFGGATALNFASQGTGSMLWPVAANLCRIVVAGGGGTLALTHFGWGATGV